MRQFVRTALELAPPPRQSLRPNERGSGRLEKGPEPVGRFALLALFALLFASMRPALAQSVQDEIRSIAESGVHPYAVAGSQAEWSDLREVYERLGWAPLWVTKGRPSPASAKVLEALRASDQEGLQPADYGADRLGIHMRELANGATANEMALFDTAMTLAVLRLVSDLHSGRIDPAAAGFGPLGKRRPLDRPAFVTALARADHPETILRQLDPAFPVFDRLRSALAWMRNLTRRSFVPLPAEMPVLHPGDVGPQVPVMRRLLEMLGDLTPEGSSAIDSESYDPSLVEAVRRFQERHGLEVDGVVGPATLRQMRIPPADRVRQIELAMERLRWLPEPNANRFIIVNIPAFHLLVFDKGSALPSLIMDVVVGKAAPLTETPVLRADMTTVIFRPYWDVPPSIARREILPRLERDPNYLKRHRMEIVDGRVRQLPGTGNALGLVKFRLPNRYHIYLHDTPARALFGRARRDFSHGCIRLADAAALAEIVLSNQPGWDRSKIDEAMTRGRNDVHVPVDPVIPVYLFYATAIVDTDDRIHFFDDIYGHDAALRKMLDALREIRHPNP